MLTSSNEISKSNNERSGRTTLLESDYAKLIQKLDLKETTLYRGTPEKEISAEMSPKTSILSRTEVVESSDKTSQYVTVLDNDALNHTMQRHSFANYLKKGQATALPASSQGSDIN